VFPDVHSPLAGWCDTEMGKIRWIETQTTEFLQLLHTIYVNVRRSEKIYCYIHAYRIKYFFVAHEQNLNRKIFLGYTKWSLLF
jgi:hypothetical protein